MKAKLVYRSFSPSLDVDGFYYKPSKEWNYLVWCDEKYRDYFIRVYGNIPDRINPVKLSLVDQESSVIYDDFRAEIPEMVLNDILENGGNCTVKIKKDSVYLGGKKLISLLS